MNFQLLFSKVSSVHKSTKAFVAGVVVVALAASFAACALKSSSTSEAEYRSAEEVQVRDLPYHNR